MKTISIFFLLLVSIFFISCSSSKSSESIPINTVVMIDMKFKPETITVKAGTTVTWHNLEDKTHNAVAKDDSWKTEDMGLGGSRSVTFAKPGTYPYRCTHHTILGIGMTGTVIVE